MNLEKYPLIFTAWIKWKKGCSVEELVKWINSLNPEEKNRLGEELKRLIYAECRMHHKVDKHYESLGIRSYKLPIFLGGLIELCNFWENKSNQEYDEKKQAQ